MQGGSEVEGGGIDFSTPLLKGKLACNTTLLCWGPAANLLDGENLFFSLYWPKKPSLTKGGIELAQL